MAEQELERELSEEERLKRMAAQMRAAEYQGLSEEEIQERERQKEMRRKKNVEILNGTLDTLKKGYYENEGKKIMLRFSPEQMKEIRVFLPEEIDALRAGTIKENTACEKNPVPDNVKEGANPAPDNVKEGVSPAQAASCAFHCENADALVVAQKIYQDCKRKGETDPGVLVLNLASATHPGGQTRKGASAQEEDLCRRTSLLMSLESEEAKKYYDVNNEKKTRMGSDGVLISPCVEVIRDASGEMMAEPFPICVMSCAAPMIRMGLEGMSQQEYEVMLCHRIQGMLLVAASQNYRHLVLGAFGCGVYGNDAAMVSDLFYHAIQNLSYDGRNSSQLFDSVDFAVLCRPEKDYNFREFYRNFSGLQDVFTEEK